MLVAAVVLAPAFGTALIAVEKVREGERRAALEGLRETVRATSLLVDSEVQRSVGALTALGNSPHLKSGNMPLLYAQAADLNQPPDVWSFVVDANGQQVFNTAMPLGTPMPPPRAQDKISQVLATGTPWVSDLIVGGVTGRLLTTIYAPAKASPGFVVAQAIAVEHWKSTTLQPHGRTDLTVGVIDRSGRFIARSREPEKWLGKAARPELVTAAAQADEGLIRHKTLEGVESYDAFAHSKSTGWTIAVAAPVASIEASANQAVIWLAAGLCAAMAIAIGATILFGRKFLELTEAMMAATRSLGQGQIPPARRLALREFDALNSSLVHTGHLLAQAQESRTAMEAEQRARLLADEIADKERAQAENAAKDRFLALLGHELRNPLAAIGGATEILIQKNGASHEDGRYLNMIKRQNRHLTRIVNDLLDVSRMLSDKIVLDSGPLNLSQCVKGCVEALRTSGFAKPAQIQLTADEVWTRGDPVRMEQIINNLLNNALKFSLHCEPIEVDVRKEDGLAVVELIDHGIGINEDLMAKIFDPFVQGPHLRGQVHAGLGIGLALVKQLVLLHEGEITAYSEGANKGSRFLIKLPLTAPVQNPVAHPNGSGLATSDSHLRVLLVEDNPDAMQATAVLLDLMGYEVVTARDGDEALEVVLTHPPDVVLMDIGLPGKSGYQVAAEIKATPQGQFIPLVALTGYGLDSQETAQTAAFDGFLIKPVDSDLVVETISTLCRGHLSPMADTIKSARA